MSNPEFFFNFMKLFHVYKTVQLYLSSDTCKYIIVNICQLIYYNIKTSTLGF